MAVGPLGSADGGSGAAPLHARRPPGRGCGRARAHSPGRRRPTSRAAGARRRVVGRRVVGRRGVSGSAARSGRIRCASAGLASWWCGGRDGSHPPRPHCWPRAQNGSSVSTAVSMVGLWSSAAVELLVDLRGLGAEASRLGRSPMWARRQGAPARAESYRASWRWRLLVAVVAGLVVVTGAVSIASASAGSAGTTRADAGVPHYGGVVLGQ